MEITLQFMSVGLMLLGVLSRHILGVHLWANPIAFFCIPHGLLVAAYLIGLKRQVITYEIDNHSITLLGLGYVAFVLGVLFLRIMVRQKTKRIPIKTAELDLAYQLTRLSVLFLFLAVLDKYLTIFLRYGNPITNIVAIRLDYVSGALDYSLANSVAFFASSLLMLNLGILLAARFKIRRGLIAGGLFLIVANDVTIGGGNWTFSSLCLLFCTWLCTKERTVPLGVSFGGLLKVGVIIGMSCALVLTLLAFRSEGGIGGDVSFTDVILYYAGGDIATFGYFVNAPYLSVPAGRHTFGGLMGIVNSLYTPVGGSFLGEVDDRSYVAYIGQPSNTSIHFSHFYSDFGEMGIMALSFLQGALSMWCMIKYQEKFTIARVQYFGLFLFVNFISIRSVPTEGKYFWILLAFLLFAKPILDFFASRKNSLAFRPTRSSQDKVMKETHS